MTEDPDIHMCYRVYETVSY